MAHPSRVPAAGPGTWATLVLATMLAIASCGAPKDIRGHGTLEIDEIDVASLVGGRVVKLYVDEGDTVRAGDTLAVLDRGEVTAGLEAQAAEAKRAAALYRDLRSGPRTPELIAARSELEAASSAAEVAESDYRRAQELLKAQAVSAADVDHAKSARDAAVARRDAARAQLNLLETRLRRRPVGTP